MRLGARVFGPRPLIHRGTRFGRNAELVARALLIASALYVVVLLLCWAFLPLQRTLTRTVELPDRQVTIVQPEPELLPAPPALTPAPAQQVAVREVADPVLPQGLITEPLPAPLRERTPALDPDAGREGRRRAEQATAELASATSALDHALGDLSSALRSSSDGTPEPSRRRRARPLGGGRGEGELAGIDAGTPAGSSADLEHSGVQGSIVAIGKLAPAPVESSGGDSDHAASAPGVHRTNASLLAVIQRYAAGIQFCYENELNREPGLRGKLVVAITVSATGEVTDATVVQSTFATNRIASCALAQIRQWKFPPIAGGATSFQTPFVFTPPN